MRGYGRHSRPHGLRGRGRGAGTCAGRLTGRRAAPQIVLDWLGKLLGLPPAFLAVGPGGARGRGGGVIQGTASEANLVALLAARARALAGRPAADALRLVAYASDQAHAALNPTPEPCIRSLPSGGTRISRVTGGERGAVSPAGRPARRFAPVCGLCRARALATGALPASPPRTSCAGSAGATAA